MFKFLEALNEILYDALEGTILTLKRFIPLTLEVVSILAPLILAIYIIYTKIGIISAVISTVVLVVVLLFGLHEKGRKNTTERNPYSVRRCILLLYLLTVPIFVWDMEWFRPTKENVIKFVRNENNGEDILKTEPISSTPPSSTTAGKEAIFLKELKSAINNSKGNSDFDGIIYESIGELKKINSQFLIPEIIRLLDKKYSENGSRSGSMSQFCIKNIIEAKAKDSCKLLYQVQLYAPREEVKEEAKRAASQICVD